MTAGPSSPKPASDTAEPVASRRAPPWLLLLALALASAPLLLPPRGHGHEGEASGARGYAAIVNRVFGGMNWLQLAVPEAGSTRPVVTLTPEAERFSEVREFVVRSPLLADIAANDETLWKIRGSHVVGLDPLARQLHRPFSGRRWTGDISYDGATTSAVLFSADGRSIQILPKAAGDASQEALSEVPATMPKTRAVVRQAFRFTDEYGGPLADVRLVGRNLVVFPLNQVSAEVWIEVSDGMRRLGRGDRRPAVLAEGGAIRFQRDRLPVGATFRLGPLTNALSTYRPFAERLTDPTLGAFGDAVEEAILAADIRDADKVPLTLNASLHRDLQLRLEEDAEKLFAQTRGVPFRAAALVMDAISGDLLALPTYPVREAAAGSQRIARAWLERNQNFSTLPIGSVAKPPVSAAILTQHPDLARLVIVGESPFEQVLGIEMGEPQIDEVVLPRIGFTEFLKRSSNRYATALMLMALAGDPLRQGPCASEPYWLDGVGAQPATQRAPLFLVQRDPSPCGKRFGPFDGRLSSILQRSRRQPHWLGVLRESYDIAGAEVEPSGSERFDTGLWRWAADRSANGAAPYRGLSPERESFRLDTIRDLHNDYISLILGGVHSRWTTVKVAEVYSRLLTGKRISARLIQSPARAAAPLSRLAREARLAVLAGMERVSQGGGTAAALGGILTELKAAAPKGETVRLFAKTGTPELARAKPVPARIALDNLAATGLLTLDSDNRLIILRRRPGESDAQALARMGEARREAARQGLDTAALAAELTSLRRLFARHGRRLGGSGGPLRLPTTRVIEESHGQDRINGGVIALVVARYCMGQTDPGRPLEALALVINVQARGSGNPATALAAQWLRPGSSFTHRLMAKPRRCPLGGVT